MDEGVTGMLWVYHDGPAPLIVAMCRAVGLTKTIDEMLRWDPSQCKLSPGLRIEAIIVNVLTNRRPLYRLEEFFRGMDVEKIFGPAIEAADLNDDAVGRALDKLAEAGRVLDLFVNMMVANVDGERVIPSNLKVPRYALGLLGFSEQIYLRWMPP